MAEHNDLRKAGESAVVAYLEQKGYLTHDRDWRKGCLELDIVTAKDNEPIAVEVKTHSNTPFAEPEDTVDLPKMRRTIRATDTYIRLSQTSSPVHFDTVTVVDNDGHLKVEHIEEALYPLLH